MSPPSLFTLFLNFLRIGAIGFGGPIALISLMEEEFCHRKKWVKTQNFQDNFVITKLFPGPIAYQMAVWLGSTQRGVLGGLVSGVGFLIPGFILILLMTAFYHVISHWEYFSIWMDGMRAGALVVIFDSIYRMSGVYLKKGEFYFLALIGAVLMFFVPRYEPLIILMGGLTWYFIKKNSSTSSHSLHSFYWPLFWVHFKAGIFIFGTGLAIIPYLEEVTVNQMHWLSRSEFIDGIAFGQITPGPVTITSAFIGQKVAGFGGAISAVLGMYLPGTLLILFLLPWIQKRITQWKGIEHFQFGAMSTVIGAILGATLKLSYSLILDRLSLITFFILAAYLIWKRPAAWIVIPLGSVVAWGLSLF